MDAASRWAARGPARARYARLATATTLALHLVDHPHASADETNLERTMQLVVTDGGAPTAPQRRRLNELLAGRTVPVAVVSGSAWVRGTVTALSWLNRKIKAFPPTGLHDVLAYLEIPASRAELIEREVAKLRHDLAPDQGERRTRPPRSQGDRA